MPVARLLIHSVTSSCDIPEPCAAFLVSLMPYNALILVGAISFALEKLKHVTILNKNRN